MGGISRPAAWALIGAAALAMTGARGPAQDISQAPAIGPHDPGAGAEAKREHGGYVLRAAGCVTCHTAEDGAFLAGGRKIASPFGNFTAPNITPDPEHGIGDWTEADFRRALHDGVSPSGAHYYPAFPYTTYTGMAERDVSALWAYLQAEVEPVASSPPGHDLAWYVSWRAPLAGWKWLHFDPGRFRPTGGTRDEVQRGAYLVESLGHCTECHTPRGMTGGLDESQRYAGAELPDGDVAPNITPHEDGIGDWSARDITTYLKLGLTPEGDFAGGEMANVISEGTSHLTDRDRAAIAAYLQELPPRPDSGG